MTSCLSGRVAARALQAKFDQILPHLDERRRRLYALYGWTKDNSWSSSSISFTPSDRDRLTPGKVRYDKISDNGDESEVTVHIAEFKARACQNM